MNYLGETKYQTPVDVARKLARRVAVQAHPKVRDVIQRQIAQAKHGGFIGIIWLAHEDGTFTVDVQVGAP